MSTSAWDPVWEDVFSASQWGRYPPEDLIRFVGKRYGAAPARAGVRILEVGCGPGANLWFLAREGYAVAGIDGSHTAIRRAGARLDDECPGWRSRGGELQVGDATSLPWPEECFDAVIDIECGYANPWEAALRLYREAARVLKPGGFLYARTFAAGSAGDGTGIPAGRGAWHCAEGGLAGKGLSRFTREDEIAELFAPLAIESVDLIRWTRHDRRIEVREWMIEARKARTGEGAAP
jgi:SAM-dependent methyltransferase